MQQAAAQTNAELAASTLDRYRQLEAEKSVSPQEMDEVSRRAEAAAANLEAVRAQTDAARAQESGARTMLGYTRLVAPFAGVVTARMADPGTMAAPGVPLLQVDQAGALATAGYGGRVGDRRDSQGDEDAGGDRWRRFHGYGGHRCGDRSCRRSGQPQLSRQDRFACFKPTARRHVRDGGVCQRRPAGDSSFRAPLLSCAARWPVRMFSTARELRNFATSPLARHKAISSKFCRAFLPARSLWTIPLTATSPASASRSSDEAGPWNRRDDWRTHFSTPS